MAVGSYGLIPTQQTAPAAAPASSPVAAASSVAGLGQASGAQQQAISQAVAQALQQSGAGGSYSGYGNDIYNALASSGQFDPTQLAALDSGWLSSLQGQGGNLSNIGGGNTNTFQTDDTAALNNALAPALTASADQTAISGLQQNPNTPAQQALAGGYNPLQPAYINQPATLNATTVAPQYLSPQLTNSLGSQQTIGALTAANQPTFNQQDQQMMQMLATAGLAPSSTAGGTAFNNLAQQQLAGMDPSIAAAIQNSQSNQLNAGQFNANTGNTASTYNANALNNASATNLQNQLAQQQYNADAYNNSGQDYFNALTSSYNNNANAFNALNSAGLTGNQNLASQQASAGNQLAGQTINTFPTYGSNSSVYGQLGSAIGGSAGGGNAGYAGSGSSYGSPYSNSDVSAVSAGSGDLGSLGAIGEGV